MQQQAHIRHQQSFVLPALLGLFALAMAFTALPGHAGDTPARNASVKIATLPPAIQVIAAAAAATTKDDGSDADTGSTRSEARVKIDSDEDFDLDAVNQKLHKAPWVIGLVFLVVGSIFLTPVILLIGIIWYKLRKTRLQNEAMLALAERGVVPPAQVAEALAAGAPPATVAPQVYQQAVAMRKRVVWSDLRKGVIMTMIGLAFLFYWMTENGSPSWVGLVLLFVGAGYVVLRWLESRHLEQAGAGRSTNGGGGPGASTG
jgi:hypothetical protein